MMDCQQAFALLQDILDKEASQIDEEQVRAHLKKCSHCFEKFRLEESVQEFLNAKIKATANSDCCSDKIESMRLNLMTQLDDIDSKCTKSKNSPFGSSFKIFLSTAALVVLAGIWYISSGFFHHQKDFLPLEQAHWSVVDESAQFARNNNQEYLGNLEKDLHYSVNTSFANYAFAGGIEEEIMGNEFTHIIYSNDTEFISVFITNDKNFEIPSELNSSKITKSDIELFDHNCRGCRLVYHKVGDLIVVTASTSKEIDLTDFIPGQAI